MVTTQILKFLSFFFRYLDPLQDTAAQSSKQCCADSSYPGAKGEHMIYLFKMIMRKKKKTFLNACG